ncbi:MAG: WecB/TagA/CpsF family glycosyltransferase [Clostridiales bacterium]|jgi:N-acetylglucosaminyldiphosphoundecaprenol N-acetyl-beta-D-mannosaminyltransferase|nr:WecB/TagA/CpsF family glycosyltransferase [Clostridiales bacterium]
METIEILGIPFAKLTQAEAIEILENFFNGSANHIIVTPNPEGVMQARRNSAFAEALLNADLSLADGTGIVVASFLLRKKLPERVRGVDTAFALFEALCAKQRNFTAYFLGGTPGVAENAKKNMESRFQYLKVIGLHHGFFSAEEEKKIMSEINNLSPDILLVCTGMPRAEILATRNRNLNAKITLCLGGTIDIMAGNVKLAPPLMRKLGLEWFHRLIRQPSRAKRMLDIPRFIFAVLFQK